MVHKPSRAVLNVEDVRQVYVCERDKIMMSSQCKHCLVDESRGSTRSVGPAYCMDIRRRPTGNQAGCKFLNHRNEKLENIREALKRKENACHSVLMISCQVQKN